MTTFEHDWADGWIAVDLRRVVAIDADVVNSAPEGARAKNETNLVFKFEGGGELRTGGFTAKQTAFIREQWRSDHVGAKS